MQSNTSPVVRVAACAIAAFFLACVIAVLTMPKVQATPDKANGKPCTACHEGSPPSKGNVKK